MTFIQSGKLPIQNTLPMVLNRTHVKGWNEAIEAAANVLATQIKWMKEHTNNEGLRTGEDFFATELAYLEPVLAEIRSLHIDLPNAAQERKEKK